LCSAGNATGTLPFVVDSVYNPTGEFGDSTAGTSVTCTIARWSAAAKGNCHTSTYTPKAADAGAQGFAGVYWQDNFNWGTQGGYAIPAGATKVVFHARGANGGEKVTFLAGYTGAASAATPCTDTIRGSTMVQTLTTTWTAYAMTLSGGYANGVLGAFGWVAAAPAGSTALITFYVDDIQYQ
jgi:hypothetical protein